MVQPSGAESCKQFSSPSSTNSSAWKISPSSRNAHVNVIIIINNALRFITVLWQLIGSSPSAHTLFKCAPYWWAQRSGTRGREEPCEWMERRMEAGLITPNSSLFFLVHEKKYIVSDGHKRAKDPSNNMILNLCSALNCVTLNSKHCYTRVCCVEQWLYVLIGLFPIRSLWHETHSHIGEFQYEGVCAFRVFFCMDASLTIIIFRL